MQAESPSDPIFNAVAVSGTTTYYSGSSTVGAQVVPGNAIGTDLNGAKHVSIVGKLTGTPSGSLTLEVSNASKQQVLAGVDVWVTLPQTVGAFTNGVASVTSGQVASAATFGAEIVTSFRRIRLKYINSSSSGTISVDQTVKR